MLKVDGDTDAVAVQEDFKNVVKEHVEHIKQQQSTTSNGYANGDVPNGHVPNGHVPNGHVPNGQMSNGHIPHSDTTLQDLESEPIDTISQKVGNGIAHSLANGVKHLTNGFASKGQQPNGYSKDLPQYTSFDREYNEVNYMDSHI